MQRGASGLSLCPWAQPLRILFATCKACRPDIYNLHGNAAGGKGRGRAGCMPQHSWQTANNICATFASHEAVGRQSLSDILIAFAKTHWTIPPRQSNTHTHIYTLTHSSKKNKRENLRSCTTKLSYTFCRLFFFSFSLFSNLYEFF